MLRSLSLPYPSVRYCTLLPLPEAGGWPVLRRFCKRGGAGEPITPTEWIKFGPAHSALLSRRRLGQTRPPSSELQLRNGLLSEHVFSLRLVLVFGDGTLIAGFLEVHQFLTAGGLAMLFVFADRPGTAGHQADDEPKCCDPGC